MHAADDIAGEVKKRAHPFTGAAPSHLKDHLGVAHEVMPEGSPCLVMFLCNHCPYVKLIATRLGKLSAGWMASGLHVVAVNSNVRTHEGDSIERMGPFAQANGWKFPYLVDADQEAARAFGAVRTPDLFLVDGAGELFYRGQFDDARPGGDVEPTGADLSEAVDLLLSTRPAPSRVRPGVGCSIKWISDRDC